MNQNEKRVINLIQPLLGFLFKIISYPFNYLIS